MSQVIQALAKVLRRRINELEREILASNDHRQVTEVLPETQADVRRLMQLFVRRYRKKK